MIRKYLLTIFLMLSISLVYATSVFAYPGGLLDGKPLRDAKGNLYYNMTDGDLKTSNKLSIYSGGVSTYYYDFVFPVDIDAYQINFNSAKGSMTEIVFLALDDQGNKKKIVFTANTSKKVDIPNGIKQVKQISISQGYGEIIDVFEFDVFGSANIPIPQYDLKIDSVESEKVMLSWTLVQGADKYNVYRDGVRVATVTDSKYEDKSVKPDMDYKYQVAAVIAGAEYPISPTLQVHTPIKKDTTPPSVVDSVYIHNQFESFTVNWKPNTEPDLDGYNVYVDGKKHNTSLIKSTSYTVRDLKNGQRYEVRISAVDKSGNESVLSPAAYAIPDGKQIPPVKFNYSLKDIVDGIAHWFSGVWMILAFSIAIPLSFYIGSRVKGLFA
ncbi:fibronectin type III domain-containing protein [Paenibacillus alvei]|uniref:fibronectin type III domain-containing protein n=1 Tax=Paenibacillus alvei TaxID=44250 RepID=UPI0022805869|nr:fibronectin type III domain-containing protein [Paenibacillus alvei]MCY7487906.1 fibronectin type III domain-containing protein [Paenibacillus alvei]